MVTPPDAPQLWERLTQDPVAFYSACAALLLALVSLGTGLARGDVAALLRPRTFLRSLGALLLGFVLLAGADALAGAGARLWLVESVRALARVPAYVVALALGPSAGLVAGALFAAATASGAFPGQAEALFAFELVVLGWLGIYPSPRAARWAGPFDVLVAHVLTWGTAGVLWASLTGGGSVSLEGLLRAAGPWPWGALVAAAGLALVGPGWYAAAFPHSRVAPKEPATHTPDALLLSGDWPAPVRRHETLGEPALVPDDPNA